VKDFLMQHGITADDYPRMLALDPFANDAMGQGLPDPQRFEYKTVLPYEKIYTNYGYKTNNNFTTSTTNTTESSNTVGVEVDTKSIITDLKVSGNWEWTISSSTKNTTDRSDTAIFNLSMPSAAYVGPPDLHVYVDKLYKTFLFSFVSPTGAQTSHFARRTPYQNSAASAGDTNYPDRAAVKRTDK
jgi:hypothetical protein